MNTNAMNALICLLILGILLTIILIPLSFSYIEYYQYGLAQVKTTGTVETNQVYTQGRYFLGLINGFLTYQADAHHERLANLSVFSSGDSNESIGLAFIIDIDFTFFLKHDEIGELHKDLASSYRSVIVSRATDAIKNEAIYVSFNEYFRERKHVEERFRDAVQKRWEIQPAVHCYLDQFHIGKIGIPDTVAEKQLESRIQNERNDQEAYLQRAQLEREQTAVEVNRINLEQDNVLRTAIAEASLVTAKAKSDAKRMVDQALVDGTQMLFEAAGISDEEQKTAFMYIRTLANRESLRMDVSYLTPESVLRTRAA